MRNCFKNDRKDFLPSSGKDVQINQKLVKNLRFRLRNVILKQLKKMHDKTGDLFGISYK